MRSQKERLNITVDKEIKKQAKGILEHSEKSISSICENALEEVIMDFCEIECRCGAKYTKKAIKEVETCKKCSDDLRDYIE